MVVTLNVLGSTGIRVNNPGNVQSNTFTFNTQTQPTPQVNSISPATSYRHSRQPNVSVLGATSSRSDGDGVLSGGRLRNSQRQPIPERDSTSFVMVIDFHGNPGSYVFVSTTQAALSRTPLLHRCSRCLFP